MTLPVDPRGPGWLHLLSEYNVDPFEPLTVAFDRHPGHAGSPGVSFRGDPDLLDQLADILSAVQHATLYSIQYSDGSVALMMTMENYRKKLGLTQMGSHSPGYMTP